VPSRHQAHNRLIYQHIGHDNISVAEIVALFLCTSSQEASTGFAAKKGRITAPFALLNRLSPD
jgi:DNA repair protein RadC